VDSALCSLMCECNLSMITKESYLVTSMSLIFRSQCNRQTRYGGYGGGLSESLPSYQWITIDRYDIKDYGGFQALMRVRHCKKCVEVVNLVVR
jgi:hypothetical protein